MTFEELLKASANGLPEVIYNGMIGKVTTIKDSKGYKGCAVRLNNSYDEWFYAEPGTDKRKKYMSDLKLHEQQQQQQQQQQQS